MRVVLVGEDHGEWARLEEHLSARDVVLSRHVDAEDFWSRPGRDGFDLAIAGRSDLPDDVGLALRKIRALPERPDVIVHDSAPEPSDALSLHAAGIFAVLPGGLTDPQLAKALDELIARRRATLRGRLHAAEESKSPLTADQFVAESHAARQALRMAQRVAASDTSLLLLGETGSGKDWLARAVHGESARSGGPFIAVNCGAVPESLLESELFGHVKGAFTGAIKDRRGYFELAHRGTLFLDEIGEMPAHLQVRLLRVLQEHTIQRVGGEETIDVDVRLIAATNRDLTAAMRSGSFRQDLYYRLAVVTLTVPPLRERLEDLPVLVELYLEKLTKKLARPEIVGWTPEAMRALEAYDWPGNVRELINVIERAVLLAEGSEIDVVDLPIEIGSRHGITRVDEVEPCERPLSDHEAWLDQSLDAGRLAVIANFERRYLSHHLERFRGSVGKTARHAGVDPRTLYSKMRQLGLRKEDFKGGP